MTKNANPSQGFFAGIGGISTLEYLKLQIYGCQRNANIMVSVEKGRVRACVGSGPNPIEPSCVQLSIRDSQIWLFALNGIHIEQWCTRYELHQTNCDGEQWEIEYKQKGRRCRSISGDNAYPENWEDFIKIMEAFAPLINPKRINRIDLMLQRSIIIPIHRELSFQYEHAVLDYSEQLIIDRETEGLTFIRHIGSNCKITKVYHIQKGVTDLLNKAERWFKEAQISEAAQKDVPAYKLAIEYHKHEPLILKGCYNRKGLPENWHEFIKEIYRFITAYDNFDEMFDPNIYNKGVKPDELIYCSISFEPWGKTYYYRTSDDSLCVGDYVVVPVGNENKERIGLIEKIEYFTSDKIPYPLEKTKTVLRKTESPIDDE